MFRKIVLVLVTLICTMNLSFAEPAKQAAVFHDTNGKVVSLKDFKGKWVIINYWAAWCSGCVKEIPELNALNKSIQGKNIVLYGVNFDQLEPSILKDAINRVDIRFPVLLEDPNSVWHLGEIMVLPATFIIDPQGRVVKELYGANTQESIMETIDELQKGSH